MMNSPEIRNLEQQIAQSLQEKPISLVPNPIEVQQFDQELPEAWTQILETEQEYTPEELQAFLQTELEIPEGDIDVNAQQALNELHQEGGIDFDTIIHETSEAPDIDLEYDQDVADVDR